MYRFEQDGEVEQYSFSDRIKVGIYDDLYIDFSELELGWVV